MKRTGYCGALPGKGMGRQITVMGWVQNIRDMGGVIFIDLRDREGTSPGGLQPGTAVQGGVLPGGGARHETVIQASGPIHRRDPET